MGQDKHMPAHSQQEERREEEGRGKGKGEGVGGRKREEEGRERGRDKGKKRGRRRERRGTVGGRESSEISTHHSPVSVSGMMHSSFYDLLQTEILWGKISTHQLIHNKRKESRGRGEEEGGRRKMAGEGKGRRGEKGGKVRGLQYLVGVLYVQSIYP